MKIVGILGSPSADSRSASLLDAVRSRLQPVASSFHLVSVRDLPAEAVLLAQVGHASLRHAIDAVAGADVVIVATPIYKAAYSGLLKAFLDLLPAEALRGKTVLPLASGGSVAHLLALDYALKPVLSALGARDMLDAVFATDAQIPRHDERGYLPSADVLQRVALTLQPLFDRADEFARREEAARERDALLARVHPVRQQQETS
jgi:FMN reductase